MAKFQVSKADNKSARTVFIDHLLHDLEALEILLEKNLLETEIMHIGAEHEVCLLDENWRPANNSVQLLKAINDPHFTTELARYNIEINLDPIPLGKHCLSQMENQLTVLLKKADAGAKKLNTRILSTGILPTISKQELDISYMTPSPRYKTLNDIVKQQRGTDISLHIKGVDELSVLHDSVLFEACNTSFQMHLQVRPADFIKNYNWAQAITGPVLGICANSPLLLGRELWNETRIALFQQSIDTRLSSYALKEQQPRVTFGSRWAKDSVTDIYKDDISLFKVVLAKPITSDSLEELNLGKIPKLEALSIHNGTIYRWNRPCYGSTGESGHLRIENRYIPAGPTVKDQMANFAFWIGLMLGRPEKYDKIEEHMDFRDAKSNFLKAARTGKESVMNWLGKSYFLSDLVQKELLPIAYDGLKKLGIPAEEIEDYLGVLNRRIAGNSGAQWQIKNYRLARKNMTRDDALIVLTQAMYRNQQKGITIAEWPMIATDHPAHLAAKTVEHIMSTRLFVVNEYDPAELATSIMEWNKIHHMPVTDGIGKLCGLLTWTHMQRFQNLSTDKSKYCVKDIMTAQVVTVTARTTITEAIKIMKENEYGCLPVVQEDELIGIITIKDVIAFDHD